MRAGRGRPTIIEWTEGRRQVACRRTEPLNAVKKEDLSMPILTRLCPALMAVSLLAACAGPAAPTPPKEGAVVTLRVAGVEDYKITRSG
jgi:hypothetical protein